MTPASLEGQMLGKYRVLEPLGRGGMAQVFRAYHPQLDRYAAIKVLRSDLVEQDEFLARFRREARSVAALRHANIVQVFDFDIQDEVYFMVMELLEGDTLKARLHYYRSQGQNMPYSEIVRIMLDVLNGLGYAHSEGVIHRDIKPANIMLTRKGQAVVTDFGIAQIVGGTQYTVSGALMGTLNYMAPEQGLKGECDVRSDLYSLGIVFYEILTGHTPFDADTPLAILMKHLNDPLPLPHQVEDILPEPFERILLKVLSKQPEDRYQSTAEMAQALQAAAAELKLELTGAIPAFAIPLSSTTPTQPGVFSGPARQQPAAVQFAADDTDANLQASALRAAGPQLTLDQQADKAAADIEAAAKEAAGAIIRNVSTSLITAFRLVSTDDDPAPDPAAPVVAEAPKRPAVTSAALSMVMVLSLGSVAILTVAGITGQWDILNYGWPIWLFLTAFGLSQLMGALKNVSLLIPVGIVLGTGYILAYCALTGNWNAWLFLWPLEAFIVLGVIFYTLRLAERPNRVHNLLPQLARQLTSLSLLSAAGVWILSLLLGFIN